MSTSEEPEKANNELKVWRADATVGSDGRSYSRITLKSVLRDLLEVLMLNKGVFFTMKELTIAPGRVIRGYLDTERWRFTHPLKYLFLLIAVYLFVSIRLDLIGAEQIRISGEGLDAQQFQQSLQSWLTDTFQLWLAFGVLFFALFSFLLFRKSGFNFTEHLVVNIYVYGHITLLYTVILPFNQMIGGNILAYIGVAVSVFWNVWAYHQTFRLHWLQSIWRGILVLLVGYLIFMIFFVLFIVALAHLVAGN